MSPATKKRTLSYSHLTARDVVTQTASLHSISLTCSLSSRCSHVKLSCFVMPRQGLLTGHILHFRQGMLGHSNYFYKRKAKFVAWIRRPCVGYVRSFQFVIGNANASRSVVGSASATATRRRPCGRHPARCLPRHQAPAPPPEPPSCHRGLLWVLRCYTGTE